jgi:hypothetical protein
MWGRMRLGLLDGRIIEELDFCCCRIETENELCCVGLEMDILLCLGLWSKS